MVVIWGTQSMGKVHQRAGQYGVVRFGHVYWMPIFPVDAFWMTGGSRGHRMKITWKGLAAGYARRWGFVAGAIGVATGGIGYVLGGAAFLLGVASLGWTNARGHAERLSDLNQLAFGTRCDPDHMPPELVSILRDQLTDQWAAIADGQTPSDVARFGTDDPRRAAVAYGLLRLTALSLPRPQAAEATKDALRIALDQRETPQLTDGGPYRNALPEETVPR